MVNNAIQGMSYSCEFVIHFIFTGICFELLLNFLLCKKKILTCRLKTLERKKKEVDHHNGETGETRQDAEYEEELDLIATKDDSLEPEVIRGVGYECKFSKSKLKQKEAQIKSRETSQSGMCLK